MNSNIVSLPLLPDRWETERLVMVEAVPADVPRLHAIFIACAYVEPWDPTFKWVAEAEFTELVQWSLAMEGDHYRFKLQPIRKRAGGEIVGYFHLSHDVPEPGIVAITMFILHPAEQRHGFGQEVVSGLADQLRGLGYTAIRLRVYLKNWPALRFWINAGFTSIIQYVGDPAYTPTSQASLRLEKRLT